MSVRRTSATALYAQIIKTCPQGRPGNIVDVSQWSAQLLQHYVEIGVIELYPEALQTGREGSTPRTRSSTSPRVLPAASKGDCEEPE